MLSIENYKRVALSILSKIDTMEPFEKDSFTFVLGSKSQGWILEAICRELENHFVRLKTSMSFSDTSLPSSEIYFFSHYSLFLHHVRIQPAILRRKNYIFFTHPNHELEGERDSYEKALSLATMVFTMNRNGKALLESKGVPSEKIHCVIGAADPQSFKNLNKTRKYIGLSQAFYQRKNPDLILELIKSCPEFQFLLLGKNWEKWDRYTELEACSNLKILTPEYKDYPSLYNEMKVFLSLSTLEGGPIPLIESMMCNVVPVVTSTGFAPDIITEGENGFLLDPNSLDVKIIKEKLESAFLLNREIRNTVIQYSWEQFSFKIESFILKSYRND